MTAFMDSPWDLQVALVLFAALMVVALVWTGSERKA